MLTYALFIATDPHPVSESDWQHLDPVFDRARLSSGGTMVKVRATEGAGHAPEDFNIEIATFINGRHLEVRDEEPDTIYYLADGDVIGTARHSDGRWLLTRDPAEPGGEVDEVAFVPDEGHTRQDVIVSLGQVVEDWLSSGPH
jgi:hypothetical protein